MPRQLWETMVELAHALTPAGDPARYIRVTGLDLDLPLEIQLVPIERGKGLVAELPRWRVPTGFDPPRSRLRLRFQEVDEDG